MIVIYYYQDWKRTNELLKSFKIEIDPTEIQKDKINQTIGICRFIYNFYLGKNKEIYELEHKFLSGFDFSKWLNNDFIPNNHVFNWIKNGSSKAVKQSIMNADKAFKNFFKGLSGFPKFKKKFGSKVGMYLPRNNETDWTIKRHKIKIPTLGYVRLKEFGYAPVHGDVVNGTITKEIDRYFVSILCNVPDIHYNQMNQNEGIGVDLGIKEFAVINNGKRFKNINKSNKIKKLEKKLRREQKSFSRKINAKKGESNINKNRLRVQKLHYKLKNKRVEYVRFVVNSLVKFSPQFIAIEDLAIKNMIKNRHLSKAIIKQNFYYFRQFLIQQCKKFGIEVRIIDRFFPSSKLCRNCGTIKTDLKLSDRVYKCDCGHVEDRDLNAAINIKNCHTYKLAT